VDHVWALIATVNVEKSTKHKYHAITGEIETENEATSANVKTPPGWDEFNCVCDLTLFLSIFISSLPSCSSSARLPLLHDRRPLHVRHLVAALECQRHAASQCQTKDIQCGEQHARQTWLVSTVEHYLEWAR
jgi:hypothetical protein